MGWEAHSPRGVYRVYDYGSFCSVTFIPSDAAPVDLGNVDNPAKAEAACVEHAAGFALPEMAGRVA